MTWYICGARETLPAPTSSMSSLLCVSAFLLDDFSTDAAHGHDAQLPNSTCNQGHIQPQTPTHPNSHHCTGRVRCGVETSQGSDHSLSPPLLPISRSISTTARPYSPWNPAAWLCDTHRNSIPSSKVESESCSVPLPPPLFFASPRCVSAIQ